MTESAVVPPGGLRGMAVPSPLHSGIGVNTFVSLHIVATLFPLAGGILIYGWRAIGTATTVTLSAVAASLLLRRMGWRGRQMQLSYVVWRGLLLSLLLPPHLFTGAPFNGQSLWPILPAAGLSLAMLSWLLGGLGAERVHPAVATFLLIFVLFHQALTPHYVLQAKYVFRGDVLKAAPVEDQVSDPDAWTDRKLVHGFDAFKLQPPADRLITYTTAQRRPDRSSLTLQMLIRDQMPPLEDLIIAGQPTSIGSASNIAVIIGGLFLIYRGLLDFRLPLIGAIAAMLALLILPIPIYITDVTTDWRWLAFRPHYLGWAIDLTFINYEIFAAPLLLTLFFLSNSPGLRPLTRRGRFLFAVCLGLLSAILQLYASASIGPYVALLVVSLMTPTLDRLFPPKTLV